MRTLPLSLARAPLGGQSVLTVHFHGLDGFTDPVSRKVRIVSIIIHRRIKPGCERSFAEALDSFTQFAISCAGHLDCHVLQRRRRGGQMECAIVNRFSSPHARQWLTGSPSFKIWLRELRVFTEDIAQPEDIATTPCSPMIVDPKPATVWVQGIVGAGVFFCLFIVAFLLPSVAYFFLMGWRPSARDTIAATLLVVILVLVSLFLAFKHHAGEHVASQ